MFEHPPELSSDVDWILQSGQAGLEELAEALFEAWYPLIYQFSFAILNDEDGARQAAVETFITALLGTHRYSSESGVQKWLLRYAIKVLSSRVQQESPNVTNPRFRWWQPNRLMKNLSNSSRILIEPDQEEFKITWQVLTSSPLKERLPALLFYQLDFGIGDIAEILKCEEHTVQFRLQKIRSQLRRELETSGLSNTLIKTGYMERLLRSTCKHYRKEVYLQDDERSQTLQEILRRSTRKQHIRRTHVSAQELGTISLVVLVIVSISWGFSVLLPKPAPSTPNQSIRATIAVQPASIVKPNRDSNQDQEISEFSLKSVIHYIVQPGDTLDAVSLRLGVSPIILRASNNLPPDGSLLSGQILVLHPISTNFTIPSPVLVPEKSTRLLTAQSSPSSILERIQDHDQYYQSLWAEGQVVLYGPAGYSGPPRTYRVQLWSIPGNVLVVAGDPLGSPDGALLAIDARAVPSALTYLALRSNETSQWFYSDSEILNRKPSLERLAYPVDALELTQKMLQFQPRNILFAPVQVETMSGRQVLVTDIASQDDEKRGRLWVDQTNGVIIRWQHFTGLQEDIVDWEVILTNVVFDRMIHPNFFKPFYYLPDHFALDHHGLPEMREMDEGISIQSSSFSHPELSFPMAPKSYDPADQWLVFQYPNTFDFHAPISNVEIFSDQYYLGSLPFGNPWTLVCSRAPDGYKIAYVGMPDNPSQDTFLNWFDLRDTELTVHNVLGGITIKELAFSPDSRYLAAYGSYRGTGSIYLVDIPAQRIQQLQQLADARSLAWNPDGTSVAVIGRVEAASSTEMLLLINIEDGQVIYRSLWDSQDSGSSDNSPIMDWGVPFPVHHQGLEGCARPPVGNE
jgi:DNA-directed RNA polymerase specialized sigma24 family protein